MKRKLLSLLFLTLLNQSVFALPKNVIIIRHAEEPPKGRELSAKGFLRAEKLADYFTADKFTKTFGAVDVLMAVKPKDLDSSIRSYQTLIPTAQKLKQNILQPYLKDETNLLGKTILSSSDYHQKTIVIAWSHKKIGVLSRALGIQDQDLEWRDGVFDRLWILQYKTDNQTIQFSDLPQKLLEGDASH